MDFHACSKNSSFFTYFTVYYYNNNKCLISSQRCRHADGGFRISGRRQLVQRGGKPASDAPKLSGTIFIVYAPIPARPRHILAGTRTSFAHRWRGQSRRRHDRRNGPLSSRRSTESLHAL